MSSGLSQAKRIASFKTPLGSDKFVVTHFDGTEGLSELFEFRIEAVSDDENVDLSKILGELCSVKYGLRGGGTRHFNGVLAEARWLGARGYRSGYSFVLKPWLWLLSHRADCKIFHDKTAPDIIKEIFNKEGKKNFDDRLSKSYQKMEYCVQYRETDLSFVLRLMEHHGIYYYFKHTEDGHKLVLSDSKSSHDTQKAPAEEGGSAYLLLPPSHADRHKIDHFTDWHKTRRLRTGKVELNDYDFKKSTSDLRRSKEDGLPTAKKYEVYDYPGKYTERKDGERFAEIRVQAQQAMDERRQASGDAPSVYPGALITIAGHSAGAENAEYLVVQATHSFSEQGYRSGLDGEVAPYLGHYDLLKSERRFRAPGGDAEAARARAADREGRRREAQAGRGDRRRRIRLHLRPVPLGPGQGHDLPPRPRRPGLVRQGLGRPGHPAHRPGGRRRVPRGRSRTSPSSSARSTTTSTSTPTSCRRTRRSRA